MQIKVIPKEKLEFLRNSIRTNLPLYRAAVPFDLSDAIDLNISTSRPSLVLMGDSDSSHNVNAVYQSMRGLPASILRDERFWAYLTHSELIEYAADRWPAGDDDDKAIGRVITRFFAHDDRMIESRQAISRLYWVGFACSRFPGNFELALEALTYRQTILADLLERPTTIELPTVFNAITTRLIESYQSDKSLFDRTLFREVQKQVNLACGSVYIESLSQLQVQKIVDGIIENAATPDEQETVAVAA